MIDYCIIALKGSGKIIIGDAPMQGCDLELLLRASGYNDLFRFYNQHSVNLTPLDFRQYSTIVDKNKVLVARRYNSNESLEIALNDSSRFNLIKSGTNKFKVSDYDAKITNSFHKDGKHIYLINKDVLSADVVINLPKPKCHRLAGITACIKNIVGITSDKACLPHRTSGSKQRGGDEYMYNNPIKNLISNVLEAKLKFEEKKKFRLSLLMRYMYGFLYHIMKIVSKDKNLIGSWYGNDTVWRMTLDLYQILLYADKTGVIRNEKQRVVFNLADMIISGERNGPVSPEPKKMGVIIAGDDAVMMDRLICEIMGFDFSKVPSVYNSCKDPKLIRKSLTDYLFCSNLSEYNEKHIDELHFPVRWRFKPYDTWKGFVEKN